MSYVRPMLLQAFNYSIFPTTKTWYYKKYTVKTTKNICRGKGSLNGAKQFHNKFSHFISYIKKKPPIKQYPCTSNSRKQRHTVKIHILNTKFP
jgi:hypothetical protein